MVSSRFLKLIIPVIIFVVAYLIFLTSHVSQDADSKYSILLSESLLHHQTFTLDRFSEVTSESDLSTQPLTRITDYRLQTVNGHTYYAFPPGSSLLSLPYVAVMNLFGVSAARFDGTYDGNGEMKIQRSLAALLMAVFTIIVLSTSRLLLPFQWAILIAVGSAFGTQVWSTASRALWSHTWGVLLLGIVSWILLRHATGRGGLAPALLATLLSLAFVVRPTNCIAAIAIAAYIFIFYRRAFIRFGATAFIWFILFVAYSWIHFGRVLPEYYGASRLGFHSFWLAMGGNLFSPSRGLLVFVPTVLFVSYLLARYHKRLEFPKLETLALAIIVAHLVVVSGFSPWWGGHCYGPRYTTELVPWFALLSVLGIKARMESRLGYRSGIFNATRLEVFMGALLLAVSVTINGLGATAQRTWLWNVRPVNVDEHPERVWDWRHPQFLARNDRDFQPQLSALRSKHEYGRE